MPESQPSASATTQTPSAADGTSVAPVVVVVVARISPDAVEHFLAFERAVLAHLPDHGGQLDHRYCSADGTTEVHVVRFPSAEAFAAYRTDPRRDAIPRPDGVTFDVYELEGASLSDLLQP
jgi:hypothetical protein